MSRLLGSYGSVRPADFLPEDADVFYTFQPSASSDSPISLTRLDSADIIFPMAESEGNEVSGLYTISLPQAVFGKKGLYSIYIKPKEIRARIMDCAFLNGTAIKGIVVDRTASGISGLSSLDGYRVEYVENGRKTRNFFRIVTSTQIVEPVPSSGTGTPSDRLISYAVNDSASLFFLTLSPSASIVDGTNAFPYIGVPNQEIILSNTFFEPKLISVNITDNTLDTIADALYGNHLKNVKTGQYGIFDSDGNIIKAYVLADVKDQFGGKEWEIRTEIPTETADLDFKSVDRIVKRGIV